MTAARYSLTELRVRLAGPGIYLNMGAFVTHVQSAIPSVAEGIHHLYPDAQILEEQRFADFHVALERPASHRRWLRPQVIFRFDGYTPFKPLPVNQAFALFEWGLNWCITTHAHQYLIIHAAVIEKEGFAAILPAPPGSGKSTLTAGLVNRGWRLLSDELGLISKAGLIQPVARPVSLKNQSIEVIRRFAPEACIGRVVKDTLKGTVSHMRAPTESVVRAHEQARPAWVIFPKFNTGAAATLEPMAHAQAFLGLARNAFNYSLLAEDGFRRLARLMDTTTAYRFHYGNLEEAVSVFNTLAEQQRAYG